MGSKGHHLKGNLLANHRGTRGDKRLPLQNHLNSLWMQNHEVHSKHRLCLRLMYKLGTVENIMHEHRHMQAPPNQYP